MAAFRTILSIVLFLGASAAAGRDWRVSPEGGAKAIEALLEEGAAEDGDRIVLSPGRYGRLELEDVRFERPVEIAAAEAGAARFDSLLVDDSEGLTFRDLFVMPDPEAERRRRLVEIGRNTSRIMLEGLEIRGAEDLSSWTAEDWRRASTGVRLDGRDHVVRGLRIFGVRYGVDAGDGARNVIEDTLIDGFSGDGLRAPGDETIVRGNTIQNCYDVDDHHDDGIQSWSRGENGKPGHGVVRGTVLSGNRIIEWARAEDDPLRCDGDLQGIGLFDGVYENWTIENNLVVVGHWHGITVLGGRNVRIVNNTVVDPEAVRADKPRIWLRPHKDGRSFGGNVVANNLAMRFALPKDAVDRANVRALYPARLFRSPRALDFRLKSDLTRGLADPTLQPARDIEGAPRPAEGGDPGAFQRSSGAGAGGG